MRRIWLLAALLLMLMLPACALAGTRALLVACSDFVSQPDLGAAISGNLHMIGSALLGASPRLAGLSIEDGTIGTLEALSAAIDDAFGDADEDDLSILYLCTHGVLSSSDDRQVYLLLGDGALETPLSGRQLCEMIASIQGEKLLILDACFSGALIGRGPSGYPDEEEAAEAHAALASPFLSDPSIHVLTSADGYESSWYFDSDRLSTGAISYFAAALSSGLGLYGHPEADEDGDGTVTLAELHRYLSVAVPSSASQLLSASAETLALPTAEGAMLSRPLTGFSYGESLLMADDPTLEFSFTVTQETAVQYRLIDFDNGSWNWAQAQTFLDEGEHGSFLLSPGRKTRSLELSNIAPGDSGYLMLQIFSLQGSEILLCSERLIAVQPVESKASLCVLCPQTYTPGASELSIGVHLEVPAEISVCVFDEEGVLVRRLAASQLTRPAPGDVWRVHWDGRDEAGEIVPDGSYIIAAETRVGSVRQKAAAHVTVVNLSA